MRTENRKLVIRRFCLTFCYSQRSKHSKDMKYKNQIEKGEKWEVVEKFSVLI